MRSFTCQRNTFIRTDSWSRNSDPWEVPQKQALSSFSITCLHRPCEMIWVESFAVFYQMTLISVGEFRAFCIFLPWPLLRCSLAFLVSPWLEVSWPSSLSTCKGVNNHRHRQTWSVISLPNKTAFSEHFTAVWVHNPMTIGEAKILCWLIPT